MSAAARFDSARVSGDRQAARSAVEDIVAGAKDASTRAAFASQGAAVSIAHELLNAAEANWWCDSIEHDSPSLVHFAPLARALRNLCAGDSVARGGACSLPNRYAPEALKLAIPALAEVIEERDDESSSSMTKKQKVTDALVASLQLTCNLIAGGGLPGEVTWQALHNEASCFSRIARLNNPEAQHRTHPVLCAVMHARFAKVGFLSSDVNAFDGEVSGGNNNTTDSDSGKVCGFKACEGIWRPLLHASVSDPDTSTDTDESHNSGGGLQLFRFINTACLWSGEALPALCRGVAPDAETTSLARDEALRRKILGMALGDEDGKDETGMSKQSDTTSESFSVEQATLLELVRSAVEGAPERDPSSLRSSEINSTLDENINEPPASPAPPTLVLSEGTLAFVLDLASRAASRVETGISNETQKNKEQLNAARVTLRACLGILRTLTERDVKPGVLQTPGDVITALCAMGMPRLLLGLLKALPVPAGIGNTSKAKGPTKAPELEAKTFKPVVSIGKQSEKNITASSSKGNDHFPSTRPWEGYRVDALSPLANAMFGRPNVSDMVYKLNGTSVILACTRGEDGDDYLREWALWAVRNLCAGSDEARREIEELQPQVAADSHSLAAAGLNVEVDLETGKVKVGNVPGGQRPGGTSTVASMSSVASISTVSTVSTNATSKDSIATSTGTPSSFGRLMMSGGDRARTPAGRAVQAALEAGLRVNTEDDDDSELEIPKNWKVADLS